MIFIAQVEFMFRKHLRMLEVNINVKIVSWSDSNFSILGDIHIKKKQNLGTAQKKIAMTDGLTD